jgi:molybdenum cofactor cytidylyltransferase
MAGQGQKPKTKDRIFAVLLAAGRSQRMGAFKPLLPFGSSTVIQSCLNYLRNAGIHNILVVLGHRNEEIRELLIHSDVTFAVNPEPDSEMADSIACGIEALPSDAEAALIALTDQPAVPPDVVLALIARWQAGALIVKPEYGGKGGHPVLIDLGFRRDLLRLDPETGLKSFFDLHRKVVFRVPVGSPFIARDLDTWDDYQTLHEEIFGFCPDLPAPNRPN